MKTWYERREPVLQSISAACEDPSGTEEPVQAYLAGLRVLKDVPVEYLAADSGWLAKETLLIFHLDPDWVRCLVDGALCIGGDASADRLYAAAASRHLGAAEAEPACGFLLRSDLVRAWPGMEILCQAGEAPLPYLRFDTLGPDLLIGIVSGRMDRLVFTEPEAGLRMGFDGCDGQYLTKRLRHIEWNLTGTMEVRLPCPPEPGRVVPVAALKEAMDQVLGGGPLPPAAFGEQMLLEPRRYTICLEAE